MLEGTRGFLRALLGDPTAAAAAWQRLLRWRWPRSSGQDDSVVGQLLPGLSAFDGAAAKRPAGSRGCGSPSGWRERQGERLHTSEQRLASCVLFNYRGV